MRRLIFSLKVGCLFSLGILFTACQEEKPSVEDLYQQYYEGAYENVVQKVEEGVAAQTIEQEIYKLYEQERYEHTINLFDELHTRAKKIDINAHFYKANSFMALSYFDNALGEFSKVPNDHSFYPQSQWFIGLLYMRKGDLEKARIILQRIADQSGEVYKKKEATELLQKLPS